MISIELMDIWTPSSMLANTTYNNATRPFIVYKQTGNVFIVNNETTNENFQLQKYNRNTSK